jgi:hypothetical protein
MLQRFNFVNLSREVDIKVRSVSDTFGTGEGPAPMFLTGWRKQCYSFPEDLRTQTSVAKFIERVFKPGQMRLSGKAEDGLI